MGFHDGLFFNYRTNLERSSPVHLFKKEYDLFEKDNFESIAQNLWSQKKS